MPMKIQDLDIQHLPYKKLKEIRSYYTIRLRNITMYHIIMTFLHIYVKHDVRKYI